MPRVLIISYYFPPAGGAGVQRVLSFVRHLPAYGWEPLVLTVEGGSFFNRDEVSLARVPPDVPVYRARTLEPFALYNRLRGRPAEEPLPVGYVGKDATSGVLGRLAAFVRANLFIPDARVGWLPFAVRAAKHLIRRRAVDAILTSSPPQTVQLIGLCAARATGVPWVADFRDPWTRIFYNADLPRTRAARKLDERLERACVKRANRLVVINEMVRDSLGPFAEGATILPNGFEGEDFAGEVPVVSDRFTLVYMGNLIPVHETATLFHVLGETVRENRDFREALSLVFVGNVHDGARQELEGNGLIDRTTFTGFLPHDEALRLLRSATIPLFIGAGDLVSAKIYEYLATGRPLLALAPPGGEVDRLLHEVGVPGAVDHGDAEGVRTRLHALFSQWKAGTLPVRPPVVAVERYTREAQAGVMARVLDEAVAGRS